MQILVSTPIVFAFLILLAIRGPYAGLTALAAILPFGMMAAINMPAIGNTSILGIDLAVLTMFVLMLLRQGIWTDIGTVFSPGRIAVPLLLLLVWAIFVSAFMPRVFQGQTEVFSLSRAANVDGIISIPLRPTTGNLSQLYRYMLCLCIFLVVALVIYRDPRAGRLLTAMKVATGVHVALGLADILSAGAGLSALLSPIRTANYALTLGQEMAGLRRMIGGFPEASSYGAFALGLFGFWLSHWFTGSATGRRGSGIWLALATFALIRCTSSSAYVGAAGFVFVFALTQIFSGQSPGLTRGSSRILISAMATLPLVIVGSYAVYSLVPAVESFIDRSLLDKLDSNSGVERMSWNRQAFQNWLDTNLLGAGLGSVRASNWVPAVLATLGLPGMVFMLIFYARLLATRLSGADYETIRVASALKMGCVALIMRSLVVQASPNMGFLFFFMAGGVAGLASAYWWASQQDDLPPREKAVSIGAG
ncbi:hypothetical protein [Jannaschia aquimarina]|uniref:O-Antigen ligase n=1 Tax=Jannaschia aquimarina TaxID=935700 RepID=A0A0D1EFB4_9RHOB|nr:hypothetical protein [Jannaschia aquimarina]KIT16304.1 hypothetical protein jaqu_19000 [Jannaschia aquimarina]SNT26544.1 hypothetical protein SAMN05421775_10985 [Jannaschia aquimarina]